MSSFFPHGVRLSFQSMISLVGQDLMLGVIKITHSLHVSTQGDLFGNGKPVE
jgi:hypothetical protein